MLNIDISEFNREIRGKVSKYYKGGAQKLSGFLNWADINEMLRVTGSYTDSVFLAKDGQKLPKTQYIDRLLGPHDARISNSAVQRAVGQGYSLVFNHIQNHSNKAEELEEFLVKFLEERVGLNVYASFHSDKAFATHWDAHDVLIMQVHGSKEWSVFDETRHSPLDTDIELDVFVDDITPFWSGTLEAGDLLYIPRGWWHHAKTLEKGSIHVTGGFTNRRVFDFLQHIINRTLADADMRSDLSRLDQSDDNISIQISEISKKMHELINIDTLNEFYGHHLATLPPLHRYDVSQTFADINEFGNMRFRSSALFPITPKVNGDEIKVEIGTREWDFAAEASDLLSIALDGGSFTVKDLVTQCPDFNEDEILAFTRELLGEGIILTA